MTRLSLILPAAALALATIAAPALALPQSQAGTPHTIYTTTQKKVNLSPITVNGKHLPFPLALQLYKKALTRSWSSNAADRNKLVCRWHAPPGTHFQYLRCQTNRQHQEQYGKTQIAFANAFNQHETYKGKSCFMCAFYNGEIPVELANSTINGQVSRSYMQGLLKKLPPANASYTLRVTGNNGKPLIDYVIKHGDLVHIYKYAYKKGGHGSH